jgi:hypothetical protein
MTSETKPGTQRRTIFVIQILFLIILGFLPWLYFSFLSDRLMDRPLGPIPVGVVWFGALGAVLISLTGVVEHRRDWDPTYALWHLSRPLMGAALAVVVAIMLQAGLLVVGTTSTTSSEPRELLYYLVAFLVGYREDTFRDLMKRLVKLVVTSPAKAPSITKVDPATAPIAGHTPVVITGEGLRGATSVAFGSREADFHVVSDTRVTAHVPDGNATGSVPVVLKTENGAATTTFQYAA